MALLNADTVTYSLKEDHYDWPTGFFELKEIEKLLRCPDCLEYLDTAMTVTKCSHTFCSLCIRKRISHKAKCPVCSVTITEPELNNNRLVDEVTKQFKAIRTKLMAALRDLSVPSLSGKTSTGYSDVNTSMSTQYPRIALKERSLSLSGDNASSANLKRSMVTKYPLVVLTPLKLNAFLNGKQNGTVKLNNEQVKVFKRGSKHFSKKRLRHGAYDDLIKQKRRYSCNIHKADKPDNCDISCKDASNNEAELERPAGNSENKVSKYSKNMVDSQQLDINKSEEEKDNAENVVVAVVTKSDEEADAENTVAVVTELEKTDAKNAVVTMVAELDGENAVKHNSSDKILPASQKVPCPVCTVLIPEVYLDLHIDRCLRRRERKEALGRTCISWYSRHNKKPQPMKKPAIKLPKLDEMKNKLTERLKVDNQNTLDTEENSCKENSVRQSRLQPLRQGTRRSGKMRQPEGHGQGKPVPDLEAICLHDSAENKGGNTTPKHATVLTETQSGSGWVSSENPLLGTSEDDVDDTEEVNSEVLMAADSVENTEHVYLTQTQHMNNSEKGASTDCSEKTEDVCLNGTFVTVQPFDVKEKENAGDEEQLDDFMRSIAEHVANTSAVEMASDSEFDINSPVKSATLFSPASQLPHYNTSFISLSEAENSPSSQLLESNNGLLTRSVAPSADKEKVDDSESEAEDQFDTMSTLSQSIERLESEDERPCKSIMSMEVDQDENMVTTPSHNVSDKSGYSTELKIRTSTPFFRRKIRIPTLESEDDDDIPASPVIERINSSNSKKVSPKHLFADCGPGSAQLSQNLLQKSSNVNGGTPLRRRSRPRKELSCPNLDLKTECSSDVNRGRPVRKRSRPSNEISSPNLDLKTECNPEKKQYLSLNSLENGSGKNSNKPTRTHGRLKKRHF